MINRNKAILFSPLENKNDLDYMIDKYIETYNIIMEARKLDPNGIYEVVYPAKDIFKLTNEDEKRSALASYVYASYNNFDHFGGQCKMGTNIQNGVVDGFLNVFGTRNLKVADLSVVPVLPDGNPSIAVEMIGLNAGRLIRQNLPVYYGEDDEEIFRYGDDERE